MTVTIYTQTEIQHTEKCEGPTSVHHTGNGSAAMYCGCCSTSEEICHPLQRNNVSALPQLEPKLNLNNHKLIKTLPQSQPVIFLTPTNNITQALAPNANGLRGNFSKGEQTST